MDVQSLATASLLLPTLVFGIVAWRAKRDGRTEFGLGWRAGGAGELFTGMAWGLGLAVVLAVIVAATGIVEIGSFTGSWLPGLGIAVYFAVLFWLEEVAFRGVLLTGVGVVVGVVPAVVIVSVLVALPYSFSEHTSLLAVAGAVVANLMNGVARWRTGRIWFGLGLRWVLNSLLVALGLPDAGFRLDEPLWRLQVNRPDWLSGDSFGLEAGLVGIAVEIVVIVFLVRFATGRTGPWRVDSGAPPEA